MSDLFNENEYPVIVGYGPQETARRGLSTRLKPKMDGGYFAVAATDFDYDVAATRTDIFAPYQTVLVPDLATGTSRTGSTRYGYNLGRRHLLTLYGDADFLFKINSKTSKALPWRTANGPLQLVGAEVYNLFLRPYPASATAQQQHILTVAVSALNTGDYFVLPATNATWQDKYFGVWFTIDGVGTVPTDSRVTDWLVVDVSTGGTSTNVADAIEAVLEAQTGYITSANNSTNDITVIHAVAGSMADAFDGTATTGFTFSTPSTNGTSTAGVNFDLVMS